MSDPVIYKIINLTNGKFYIGSTNNTKVRFRTHRNKLRKGCHHCAHLQAAWNMYGEEAFIFKVVSTIAEGESLQEAEDLWLLKHFGAEHCYNTGRRSGAPWRGGIREKHPNFGSAVSDEERQRISNTLKSFYAAAPENHPRYGKRHTEETKRLISEHRKGKMAGENHYRYGQTVSDEVKKKIGDAQRGVKKNPREFTPEGLVRAQANMRRNMKTQTPLEWGHVIAKFPPEVCERYDFTNAAYTGALERITGVICPVHGGFSQYSAQFRKGRGCPSCGAVTRAAKKKAYMLKNWGNPEFRESTLEAQNIERRVKKPR